MFGFLPQIAPEVTAAYQSQIDQDDADAKMLKALKLVVGIGAVYFAWKALK